MLSNRALVATVLVSSVLWVGLGAAGTALAYGGGVPAAVTSLVLPPTVPSPFWFRPPREALLTGAVAGLLHAAVLALLLRVVLRRAAPGLVTIWFAVVVTAFVATGLVALGSLIRDPGASGLRALLGQTVSLLAPSGLWGVVWGWVPALVGARLSNASPPTKATPLPSVIAAVAAVAVALLVLPTLGRQPQPAATPTPAVTHFGWAGIPPTAPDTGTAADACESDDLTLTVGAGDAATGHRALAIRVDNRSDRTCTLNGYADVVFDDREGDAMSVLVVRGGSFMATDRGARRVRLAPGQAAFAQLGWNAQSAAGEQRAGTLFVSAHPGADRLPAAVDLDVKDGGAVALTAWAKAPTS